ncbi:hypothetical protein [Amycolatopsis sp.]|uniref:hypothetical protein n=1 Tax=Amycolatopsis sp. TaxID=37632 RepID=UPI002D80DB28|nr:hypothetical protein [Amycolatopsis sp.]HET6706804.1 hypothetical protein [Amycolatopsis sp.]
MKRLFTVPALLLASLAGLLSVPAAAQAATTDVGVIPASRSCPVGTEAIVIRMDDEDSNNENARGGFIGAVSSTSNTEMFYCRVNGTAFRGVVQSGSFRPYAVLKLGANCPNGSQEFSRRFDNEDDSNNNSFSGNIFPNVSDSNTLLRFCLFAPGVATTTAFPNVGFSYLVFSGVDSSGFFRTDDEDDSNNNQYTAPAGISSIAQSMVSAGPNTTMNVRIAQ